MFSIKNVTGSIGSYILANQPKNKYKMKPWRNFWKYKPLQHNSSTSGKENRLSFQNEARSDSCV